MVQLHDGAQDAAPAGRGRRSRARHLVKVLLALAAVGLLVLTAAQQGRAVLDHARELSPWALVAALVAVLFGLGCAAMSWRSLLDGLGSSLSVRNALRIYFLGQLGKYLPGSIWSVVAQSELARGHEVPRRRSAAASLLSLVVGVLTGVIAAAALLSVPGTGPFHRVAWLALIPPALVPLLVPRSLTWGLDLLLRALRRPDVTTLRLERWGAVRAAGWAFLMWLAFGVQVWVLAMDLDARPSQLLVTATGVYAAAWVAGFVVLLAPAGVGVREAVLVGGLSAAMGRPAAVVVALCSRLLMTLGDATLALAVTAWGRLRVDHQRGQDAAGTPADEREIDGSTA